MECSEQVGDKIDLLPVSDASIDHLLWGDHPCRVSGCSPESCEDGCYLLVWLQVSQHDPQREVGDVGSEAVVVLHLR